jgi:hypothetical protein
MHDTRCRHAPWPGRRIRVTTWAPSAMHQVLRRCADEAGTALPGHQPMAASTTLLQPAISSLSVTSGATAPGMSRNTRHGATPPQRRQAPGSRTRPSSMACCWPRLEATILTPNASPAWPSGPSTIGAAAPPARSSCWASRHRCPGRGAQQCSTVLAATAASMPGPSGNGAAAHPQASSDPRQGEAPSLSPNTSPRTTGGTAPPPRQARLRCNRCTDAYTVSVVVAPPCGQRKDWSYA